MAYGTSQRVAEAAQAAAAKLLDAPSAEAAAVALVPAALGRLMPRLRAALFPAYFPETARAGAAAADMALYLTALGSELAELIGQALRLREAPVAASAAEITARFLEGLPAIRELIESDVQAALAGDPAAPHRAEVILGYPSIQALSYQRLAHRLYLEGVPLIPRLLTELGHAATGIDIHPGARIGSHFFIDHGSGVVIGETAIVGDRVRLYQGVTLGAKSFPRDAQGRIVKGLARHPIIGNDVVVYSGATILGRITVGDGSVIGGNVWLTHDVPAHSRVQQLAPKEEVVRGHGDGI